MESHSCCCCCCCKALPGFEPGSPDSKSDVLNHCTIEPKVNVLRANANVVIMEKALPGFEPGSPDSKSDVLNHCTIEPQGDILRTNVDNGKGPTGVRTRVP